MSNENDQDPTVPGTGNPASDEAAPVLPTPVQEHLGKQLRTTYHALEDKPAFLGDTALPAYFEKQIHRLETRERLHQHGIDAVKSALQDLSGDGESNEQPRRDRDPA